MLSTFPTSVSLGIRASEVICFESIFLAFHGDNPVGKQTVSRGWDKDCHEAGKIVAGHSDTWSRNVYAKMNLWQSL